jgi:hypothetical protein
MYEFSVKIIWILAVVERNGEIRGMRGMREMRGMRKMRGINYRRYMS